MAVSNRLKMFLEKLISKLFPHERDCNIVCENWVGGVGCTCNAGEEAKRLIEEIKTLNDPDICLICKSELRDGMNPNGTVYIFCPQCIDKREEIWTMR